jgi:hypothetical protein
LFCMLSGTAVNPFLVPAFASSIPFGISTQWNPFLVPAFASSIPFGISTQWHCQPND